VDKVTVTIEIDKGAIQKIAEITDEATAGNCGVPDVIEDALNAVFGDNTCKVTN